MRSSSAPPPSTLKPARGTATNNSGNALRRARRRIPFLFITIVCFCVALTSIPLWLLYVGFGFSSKSSSSSGSAQQRLPMNDAMVGGHQSGVPPPPPSVIQRVGAAPAMGGQQASVDDDAGDGDVAAEYQGAVAAVPLPAVATMSPEEQQKWEAVHISKKLPLLKDLLFLEPILGEKAIGRYPRISSSSPSSSPSPLRTFDDMIKDTMDTAHYVHNKSLTASALPLRPCDASTAPFSDAAAHRRCVTFLRNVLGAAFEVASRDGYAAYTDEYEIKLGDEYRWVLRGEEEGAADASRGDASDGASDATLFYVSFAPLLPKFEQRTIKYKAAIWNKARTAVISAVLKVPQMLFPREPFSEIMAHRLDRLLGINRIPPIALFDVSVDVLRNISKYRKVQKVHMDEEFLQESRVKDYDEWIDKDLYYFVKNNKGIHHVGPPSSPPSGGGNSLVYLTAQLFMNEVRPLLETQLIVPYNKKNPGWHRWFIIGWNETAINNASLLALSELSLFDFITMNDDRSPNKNNFAIGGCKRCTEGRRPSGMAPTLLHLDQGMSQWGSGHILSHSPIGKQRDKVKFCIFYKPLLATIYQQLVRDGDNIDNTRQWFLAKAHPAAVKALGKGLLGEVSEQMWRVMRRLLVCLNDEGHSFDEVLRPNAQFLN